MVDDYHIRLPYEDAYMTGQLPRLKKGFDTITSNLDVASKDLEVISSLLSGIVSQMEELRKELEKL